MIHSFTIHSATHHFICVQ